MVEETVEHGGGDSAVRRLAISGNGIDNNYGTGEKLSERKVKEIGVCKLRAVA